MFPLDVGAGSGEVYDPLVAADPAHGPPLGETYAANMSAPSELYAEPGIGVRECSPVALADIARFS